MRNLDLDIHTSFASVGGSGNSFARQMYADSISVLLSRAQLLEGRDRAIMIMYLDSGNSIGQIARVAGVTEACMSRRIRRLIYRLTDGEFICCLKYKDCFDALELDVAKDFFLVGISQRAISQRREVSVYKIRKIISKMRAFKKKISNTRSCNV